MNKPKKKEDKFSTLSVYINKLYYMKHNETMNKPKKKEDNFSTLSLYINNYII